MIDVSLLGTGGMMPLPNRFLTSLLIRSNGKLLLIDCGEGTQVTLKMLGWGFKNIEAILFTHFHADHISGLIGMLLTIGNSGRKEPLNILGQKGIKEVCESLRIIAPELPFSIHYTELTPSENITEVCGLTVTGIPVEHRVPCMAYSLKLNRRGKFNVDKAVKNKVPKHLWSNLQKGGTASEKGITYIPDMVLGEERKGIKITYATDCRPSKQIVQLATGSDLFICEGMYADNDLKEKAIKYKHMVFSEAAEMALNASVRELWLTHFSPSLLNPEESLKSATDIFENTIAGYDRLWKTIYFDSEL